MDFAEKLQQKVIEIEAGFAPYMPKEEGSQKTLFSAMNYSLYGGGKRLRPMLMHEAYLLFGGKDDDTDGMGDGRKPIYAFMAAQEMIHTYSLVHDDLPAMDDDRYRRGRETTHIVYGDAMAVLAGDGLLNLAFEVAAGTLCGKADPKAESGVPDGTRAASQDAVQDAQQLARCGRALSVLARKAGVYGMIGGQAVDVEAEKQNLELNGEKLLFIHEHKTAALIQSALMIGAILAGAEEEQVRCMEQIGYNVGVAFQIQDDILDVTSTLEVLGKPIGSDEKNGKLTYVSAYGLEKARADVERMSREAIEMLHRVSGEGSFLEELIASLIYREK